MIEMTAEQTAAIRTEMARVIHLAEDASIETETTAMRKGLLAVRMATINAVAVINDIEADIRMRGASTKEHAHG